MPTKKKKQTVKTPYDEFDELNLLLSKKISKYFNQTRLKLSARNYRKLTYKQIVAEVKALYGKIQEQAILEYYESAKRVYGGIDRDELLDFLEDYYIVTKYAFFNEWERKSMRFAEALYSVVKADKSLSSVDALQEQKRAVNLLKTQIDEYGVYVIDRAIVEQGKKDGMSLFEWQTEEDLKVCDICKRRNGHIYSIDKIPAKPHIHCRCWLKATKGEDSK